MARRPGTWLWLRPMAARCPQRHRNDRRNRRDDQRVLEAALPFIVGEEIAVVFQRIPLRVQPQHLGREGKEVLCVERQRQNHKDRRDQEDKDGTANYAEQVMLEHLPTCQIGQ